MPGVTPRPPVGEPLMGLPIEKWMDLAWEGVKYCNILKKYLKEKV